MIEISEERKRKRDKIAQGTTIDAMFNVICPRF